MNDLESLARNVDLFNKFNFRREITGNTEQRAQKKRQFNPSSSSLTNSQAKEFATESNICSDGYPCGDPDYCEECPNNHS